MEEQLKELAEKVAALESGSGATNTMFAETYYYITIALMVVIHAGFLAYEMGASRHKNVLASGIKNILAFAFVIPAFYFIGWPVGAIALGVAFWLFPIYVKPHIEKWLFDDEPEPAVAESEDSEVA